MPNGYGPLPDCVHCMHFINHLNAGVNGRCGLHNIQISLPLYVFCNNWKETNIEDIGWIEEYLDRKQIDDGLLYRWFPIDVRRKDGTIGDEITYDVLGSLQLVGSWNEETFLDTIKNKSQEKRDNLRRSGLDSA